MLEETLSSLSTSPLALALDLGGTKLSLGLFSYEKKALKKVKVPIQKESFQSSVRQIRTAAEALLRESQLESRELAGVGVIVPGIYYADTGMAWAPNLWGREPVPLREELSGLASCPVRIDSDRAGYVLGEQWAGIARGKKDVVFVAIGTGIGAGITSGGQLCRGASGIAGALGWMAVNPLWKPIYREVGCLEAEAAGPAVVRKAREKLLQGESSLLTTRFENDPMNLTAEQVVQAAREGDSLALSVLEEVAGYLAMAVANLISLLNPEMIVLGGGLMQAGDLILQPIRRRLQEWAQPVAAPQTRIELSQLGEDAGLYGAACLAFGNAG